MIYIYIYPGLKHFDLDLSADFKRSVLSGNVKYTMDILKPTRQIRLDINYLNIFHIHLYNNESKLYDIELSYKIKNKTSMGSELVIQLPSSQAAGSTIKFDIAYEGESLITLRHTYLCLI